MFSIIGDLMIVTKENREHRFSIRATPKQKDLIRRAAMQSNKSISEFVLEHSLEAAKALEMDNAELVLSFEDHKAFLEALDTPPAAVPALKKLFSEPGVILSND